MNDLEALNLIGKLSHEMEMAARKLPAYPAAARKIAQMIAKGSSPRDLGKALASDPVLSAKALKIANSSYFGFSRQIGSPLDAAQILGASALGALASACAMSSIASLPRMGNFEPDRFFSHALLTACLAKRLACSSSVAEPDVAFGVGLLHDLGGALLAVSGKSQNCGCCGCESQSGCGDQDIEHAQVGAALAIEWNFPADFGLGILTHHDSDNATILGKIANLACKGAHAIEADTQASWAGEVEDELGVGMAQALTDASVAEEERNRFKSIINK